MVRVDFYRDKMYLFVGDIKELEACIERLKLQAEWMRQNDKQTDSVMEFRKEIED
jgi:hypothetical protein